MNTTGEPVRAFAPAGVGNIGVGFDLLGHSIVGPRDIARVLAHRRTGRANPEHRRRGRGCGFVCRWWSKTTRRVVRCCRCARPLGLVHGFELELEKGIALGSGLGGSAASCVAALVAANALLDAPLSREALYPFALDGESVSSNSRQGDNVAPMLLGGVVMATAIADDSAAGTRVAALRGGASRPGPRNAARTRGAGRAVSAVGRGPAEHAPGAVPDRPATRRCGTDPRRPAGPAGGTSACAADSRLRPGQGGRAGTWRAGRQHRPAPGRACSRGLPRSRMRKPRRRPCRQPSRPPGSIRRPMFRRSRDLVRTSSKRYRVPNG